MNFENQETAKEGIAIKISLNTGLPTNFEIGQRDIPKMVEKMQLGENGSCGQFVKLKAKDVEAIYRLAL